MELFEQIKGIAEVQNKAIMSGIELGRGESAARIKKLEAEKARLRAAIKYILTLTDKKNMHLEWRIRRFVTYNFEGFHVSKNPHFDDRRA